MRTPDKENPLHGAAGEGAQVGAVQANSGSFGRLY